MVDKNNIVFVHPRGTNTDARIMRRVTYMFLIALLLLQIMSIVFLSYSSSIVFSYVLGILPVITVMLMLFVAWLFQRDRKTNQRLKLLDYERRGVKVADARGDIVKAYIFPALKDTEDSAARGFQLSEEIMS